MIAAFALAGLLTASPLSLSAGDGLFANAAAASRAGSSYQSQDGCFDTSGKGLSGALQIDAGTPDSNGAPSQEEPRAGPGPDDCALV